MFEIRVLVPEIPAFDPARMAEGIQNALDTTAEQIRTDFLTTVQTWNHNPEFKIDRGVWDRRIYTVDEIYAWVNNGTEPHTIAPVTKKALRFLTGGRAKTEPGFIGSTSGAVGSAEVVTKRVNHPGGRPRRFDEEIGNKWQEEFPAIMQQQINQVPT